MTYLTTFNDIQNYRDSIRYCDIFLYYRQSWDNLVTCNLSYYNIITFSVTSNISIVIYYYHVILLLSISKVSTFVILILLIFTGNILLYVSFPMKWQQNTLFEQFKLETHTLIIK